MQTSSDMEDVHGISNGFRSTSAHRLYRHGQGMFYRVIAMFKTLNTEFLSNQMFHFLMKWIEIFRKLSNNGRATHIIMEISIISRILRLLMVWS